MAYPYPKIQYGGFVPSVIRFPYPPTEGNRREVREADRKVTTSLSGLRQTQVNFVEGTRKFKFKFLNEETLDQLEIFFDTHAVHGRSFKFFEDDTALEFKLYELDQAKLEPKIITGVNATDYIYEVELAVRRVLETEGADGYMQLEVLNGAGPIDIPGLNLDGEKYRTAKVFYEIWRKTDLEERVVNGEFTLIYQNEVWSLAPGNFVGDPPAGVTFEVSAEGQVSYLADEMAGDDYEGELLLRDFTIIGG